MNAQEHRSERWVGHIALDESYVLKTVGYLAERYEAEMTVGCGHVHLLALLHKAFMAQTVGNQVGDGDDLEAPLAGSLLKLRETGHGAVGIEDLDKGRSRTETCEACKVDTRFGVAGAAQHALILGI